MASNFPSSLFAFTGLVALIAAGCNAQLETVLRSDSADGGAPGAEGGTDAGLSDAGTSPENDAGALSGDHCRVDQDCNALAAQSSLAGTCFEGYCFCKAGFFVQPNGKCGLDSPLCSQLNASHCVYEEKCPAGERQGTLSGAEHCGDVAPPHCCTPNANCAGPDVSCCSTDSVEREAQCINGFLQCEEGSPMKKGAVCN